MKNESNKNWTTCLRLNTGDGSPRVFLLNSHFLGSVPICECIFYIVLIEKGQIWTCPYLAFFALIRFNFKNKHYHIW